MAIRKPLVIGGDGVPQQLQSGDQLDGTAGKTYSRIHAKTTDTNGLTTEYVGITLTKSADPASAVWRVARVQYRSDGAGTAIEQWSAPAGQYGQKLSDYLTLTYT